MSNKKNGLQQDKKILSELKSVIKESSLKNESFGFLYISIENLPMIISSQNSEYADELFINLSADIKELMDNKAIVIRTDRNHINVIIRQCNATVLENKAQEVYKYMQNYGCKKSLIPIQLIARIGGVIYPDNAENAQEIIDNAFVALNDARELFLHYAAYGNKQKHKLESRNQLVLANYIQSAFIQDKLTLAYQPIINSKTSNIECYECLLRIINDNGGVSSAGPFIPIAEKMGFIDVIDAFVLKMAVQELQNHPTVKFSINVSNASIYNSDWINMASDLLSDPKIASRLTVEITETAEQHDARKAARFIITLQALGCKVALDDFGSGHTSFAQLRSLPIDEVKIDGSFIRDIALNRKNKLFVESMLTFCQSLKLKSVAEFVESEEIAKILKEMGVDYLQGNYFSPAIVHRAWL